MRMSCQMSLSTSSWAIQPDPTLAPALVRSSRSDHPAPSAWPSTANLRTKILDFRGFDSSIILRLRGGILMSIGSFPESLVSRNLSRDNLSREIGGIAGARLECLCSAIVSWKVLRQGILVEIILVGRLGVAWDTPNRQMLFNVHVWNYTYVITTYLLVVNTSLSLSIYIYIYIHISLPLSLYIYTHIHIYIHIHTATPRPRVGSKSSAAGAASCASTLAGALY